jgi:hypothetical protein
MRTPGLTVLYQGQYVLYPSRYLRGDPWAERGALYRAFDDSVIAREYRRWWGELLLLMRRMCEMSELC